MNNIRHSENLIQEFKKKFKEETGRGVKVSICGRWEGEANFTDKGDFWAIVKTIFDYTSWDWGATYAVGKGARKEEKIFRRGIIDYISMNNGVSSNICKEAGGRDHTTVLHSVKGFATKLENDYYTQKIFGEIITYVKENYHLNKGKHCLKAEIIGTNQ